MALSQMSIFDGSEQFHNDKPIRLIELFGGYGSQSLALKYLGIQFEHWRLSEWAVKSIQAYKDMHFANDNTDYSKDLSVEQVRAWLYGKISADYNAPMTEQKIDRLSEKQVRMIYNNMQATHNLGSITQIKAYDLAPMLGMGHKALVDAVREDKNAVMEKLRQIGYEGKIELRNKYYSYFIRRIGNATESTRYIGKKGRSRPVIQLNKQNEVIAEFASIKEASQKTGINYNHIVNQLHGVVHNGNFEWKYKESR